MHESFHSLTSEKQTRIINAAMQIFSQSPYNKASTDDIAALAGISKGALFYHFKNKRELYSYLYQYGCKKVYEKIEEQQALEEKDFFERNKKVIEARVCTMIEYPYIFDFLIRAYYEIDKVVEVDIKSINEKILNDAFIKLNENIDTSKFKNVDDINKAIKMLVWLGDGFINEKRAQGSLGLRDLQTGFNEYIELLKIGFYK